ncbi:hypothetical protein CB1_001118011 [Camelus ferus]|nr:hypothetical protein CB1_001118011 [Camelus ferus]
MLLISDSPWSAPPELSDGGDGGSASESLVGLFRTPQPPPQILVHSSRERKSRIYRPRGFVESPKVLEPCGTVRGFGGQMLGKVSPLFASLYTLERELDTKGLHRLQWIVLRCRAEMTLAQGTRELSSNI